MKRRMALLASIIIAALCFPSNVLADELSEEKTLVTPELALEMAQSFADSVSDSDSILAANATKLFDSDGQAIGYIVAFVEDDAACGYVVFDNTDDSLIAEYVIDEDAVSPYEVAKQEISEVAICSDADLTVAVKTAPYDYAAVSLTTGVGCDMYGSEVITGVQALSSESASEWSDVFFGYTGDSRYTIVSSNSWDQFYAFSESYIEEKTSKYACAVTAMLNVATMYMGLDFPYSSFSYSYDTLWTYSATTVYKTENGVEYGSTQNNRIGSAVQQFLSDYGYSISYSLVDSPSFSSFVAVIDSNNVSIFNGGILKSDDDGTVSRKGHSMTVEGYAVLNSVSTGETVNALIVADGWGWNARYLNLAFANWTDTSSVNFER